MNRLNNKLPTENFSMSQTNLNTKVIPNSVEAKKLREVHANEYKKFREKFGNIIDTFAECVSGIEEFDKSIEHIFDSSELTSKEKRDSIIRLLEFRPSDEKDQNYKTKIIESMKRLIASNRSKYCPIAREIFTEKVGTKTKFIFETQELNNLITSTDLFGDYTEIKVNGKRYFKHGNDFFQIVKQKGGKNKYYRLKIENIKPIDLELNSNKIDKADSGERKEDSTIKPSLTDEAKGENDEEKPGIESKKIIENNINSGTLSPKQVEKIETLLTELKEGIKNNYNSLSESFEDNTDFKEIFVYLFNDRNITSKEKYKVISELYNMIKKSDIKEKFVTDLINTINDEKLYKTAREIFIRVSEERIKFVFPDELFFNLFSAYDLFGDLDSVTIKGITYYKKGKEFVGVEKYKQFEEGKGKSPKTREKNGKFVEKTREKSLELFNEIDYKDFLEIPFNGRLEKVTIGNVKLSNILEGNIEFVEINFPNKDLEKNIKVGDILPLEINKIWVKDKKRNYVKEYIRKGDDYYSGKEKLTIEEKTIIYFKKPKLILQPGGGTIDNDDSMSEGMRNKGESLANNKDFLKELSKLAKNLGANPNDLLKVFFAESGNDPRAVNPDTKATGLIQFLPKTANALGTSIEDLRKMSAIEQLKYVGEYLKNAGGGRTLNSVLKIYQAIFYPISLNKSLDFIFGSEKSLDYAKLVGKQNPGIAKYGDGELITNAAFAKYVNNISNVRVG